MKEISLGSVHNGNSIYSTLSFLFREKTMTVFFLLPKIWTTQGDANETVKTGNRRRKK
jgi:hypothetical protein